MVGPISNPMKKGASEAYKSMTLAVSAAKAKSIKEQETVYLWAWDGEYQVSLFFPGKVDPHKVRSYNDGIQFTRADMLDYHSNPPGAHDLIVKYLNSLSKKEIKSMLSAESVPVNARLSLMVFIRDWRVDDPSHEDYLQSVKEGVSQSEALRSGDLLNFLIAGGWELELDEQDEYALKTRWTEYIGSFLNKLPAGKTTQDLVGLHVKVLEMLPLKSYTQYSIAEIFVDNPDIKDMMLGEPVLLSPIEFKALTGLQGIVESGSIGQFKLALQKGSSKGMRELAQKRGGDIGGLVLSAYKIAAAAVGAFKLGDYRKAKTFMEDLQRQYGIGAGSFTAAEETMFIATLSSVIGSNKKTSLATKGNTSQVLLSVDTTFSSDADKKGSPAQAALAARHIAQEKAWKYNGYKVERNPKGQQAGTNGYRTFTAEHTTGNSSNKSTALTTIVSTDWLAIFWAIANAEKVVDSKLNFLAGFKVDHIYDEVFKDPAGATARRVASAAYVKWDRAKLEKAFPNNGENDGLYHQEDGGENWNKKGHLNTNAVKSHLGNNEDKDNKKRAWKDFQQGASGGKAATPTPSGGGNVKDWEGKEPMYRFLVHSDLQNANSSLVGSLMPLGVMTVVLRATEKLGMNQNHLPFEADLFYESFYEGDTLDSLIPSNNLMLGGKDEGFSDLNELDLSTRQGRRRKVRPEITARNPPFDVSERHQQEYGPTVQSALEGLPAWAETHVDHKLEAAIRNQGNSDSYHITIYSQHAQANLGENAGYPELMQVVELLTGKSKHAISSTKMDSIMGLIGSELSKLYGEVSLRHNTGGGGSVDMWFKIPNQIKSNPDSSSRQARKKSSSKKPSAGNMIGIELTPRSQIKSSTAVDKADWMKKVMKEDQSGILKELWNEYAKGDNTKVEFGWVNGDKLITGVKWRGKVYPFSQTEMKGGKTTNKKRRKQYPVKLRELMGQKGTYADYKGGQANMRMIYAQRKDNGKLVPFRISLPKILLRKRADKVIPKKGGHKEAVAMLLSKIEESFGNVILDKRFTSHGGHDVYKVGRDGGSKFDVPVDRGIHLLFKAQGLDTKGAYSTNAFPSGVRAGGAIIYRAMTADGKPVDMEVES